jgi:hypothetical protein
MLLFWLEMVSYEMLSDVVFAVSYEAANVAVEHLIFFDFHMEV